jgi:hypothetical protein
MSNNTKKDRTYNWKLILDVPRKDGKTCKDLQKYIEEQVTGIRKQGYIQISNDPADCTISFQMTSPGSGSSGPNNLKRNLMVNFPGIRILEITRLRKNEGNSNVRSSRK